ncbi:MAG TPA: hypothetical protein VHR64_17095, partial [Thermomicrobiales bacterium]|nr:hypothetical protein [Thermomicrobiales bacterium]
MTARTGAQAIGAQGAANAMPEVRRGPSFWDRFKRNRLAVVGLAILVVLGVAAVIGPPLVDPPRKQNVVERFERPSI